jgi:L-ribulose-5-phosphate 3-epimerase
MNHTLDRRAFLKQSAALTAGLGLTSCATSPSSKSAKRPLFKISLAEWSLHKTLFDKKLDPLDFPRTARQEYGIDAVEYVNQFWMDKAKDRNYLTELKKRCDGEGVRSVLIMCDDEGDLGDADAAKRRQAVENHFKWVEAAKFLGCHAIRVNAEGSGTPEEQRDRIAEALRRLTEFGGTHGLNVIVENHGGLSSNGQWLASVIRKVNLPNCGTLPDFGNFETYDRYQGVTELMPFAKGVSAKSHDFDDQGNEIHTDYRRMLKIVLDAGYHGYLGIEYEGEKLSEPDGIRATKRLVERVQGELS